MRRKDTDTPDSQARTPPVVDVVIPTLGGSPYLRDAVESVFAQTLPSWRLIVSENGTASDEVAAALSDFVGDERVQHHVVGETITMAENWTRAIRFAEAPYVAMLHDDDRWHPDFLARRVGFMSEHPTCGFVFGGYNAIGGDGAVLRTVVADLPSGLHRRSEILPILYDSCLVTPPTALVRASAYAAVGAEYREVLMTDYDMWLRLAARFDVGYLAVPDADYRFHSAQNTTKHRVSQGRAQLEVFAANDDLPVAESVRRRSHGRAHLLSAIDHVELGERRQALQQIGAALRSHPGLALKPASGARILLSLLAVALGERGRRAFAALRLQRFVRRNSARAHSTL